MFGSFFKPLYYLMISIIVLTIFITCFFMPFYTSVDFEWPIPGYETITSPFGKRASPTAGATTFHKGIDIGAPEGTYIIAAIDGQITFTGFLGGGGYTVTLSSNNMKITYCHVSPNFLVEIGEFVRKGQIIAQVGPKYVYGVKGNTYHDENGNPTNGAITGCHLHFGIRINEEYVNPLEFFKEYQEKELLTKDKN